ncbi:3'-5' exoribonuclease [Nocardiopsis sp. HNM0947]|uniref:3'-5' exoribonuclease n=1 Tax=Nocardiopsis coralli TaxID=2772213 RepID=A0ABR9P6L1_9ACTN|nr:exonuclease domain-containing protein [Nocardiopsis coralli]MBE2999488.1 3'-5' exoribonuclease [Nocardiopsis coralli]
MLDTWTAIDFETANNDRGSACAVGLVRVSGGRVVERYSTLIRPPRAVDFFSFHNTAVHGITAQDVAEAPGWERVHADIVAFADGSPLVAHNAAFDVGVLRQACAHSGMAHPEWDYACTLALSRRTWADLADHKLPTVCAHIGHTLSAHHRADADAEAAARVLLAAMEHHGTTSLLELSGASGLPLAHLPAGAPAPAPAVRGGGGEDRFSRWQRQARSPLPQASPDADPDGPLFGQVVCISGDLRAMDKTEAWKRVAEAGGHPAKNVTKKTGVLVAGGSDHGGKSSKHRQAEDYAAKGQRIRIVDEAAFLSLLGLDDT